jgi:hypothetical protein
VSARLERVLAAALSRYPRAPDPDPLHATPAFWLRAAQGGVTAVLAEVISPRPEVIEQLRAQTALGMRAKGALRQALAICKREGIDALPLKGPLLGARLYEKPFVRPTSDVDLLVRAQDLNAVREALVAAGGAVRSEAEASYLAQHHHAVNITFHGVLIEVHLRASTNFGVTVLSEPLLARSHPATVDGIATRVLEPHDELVYLALHAAAHNLTRDILLLDLRRLAERESLDPDTLRVRAIELGLERPVAIALAAAVERCGFEVTRLPRAWRGRVPRELAALVHRVPPQEQGSLGDRLLSYSVQVLFAPSVGRAGGYVRHHALRLLRRRASRLLPGLVPPGWAG